jgi:8-oxo-dGTP diphosphatase
MDDYDPNAFDRPSLAVDVVPLSIIDAAPHVLLVRRKEAPFADAWALPGGFVGIDEAIDTAATRALRDKAGITEVHLEQLYTFGAIDRDPRMRIVSVAHLALMPAETMRALPPAHDRIVARLGADGGAIGRDGTLALAFDHATILRTTIERLRGKIDWSPIGFALLPPLFTLRALQEVHEAILGRPMNKPAFRRRMLDRGWLAATSQREEGTSFRPAELYRFKPEPTP